MSKVAKIQNAMRIVKDGETVGRLDISGEVGWDWYGDAWDAGYFNQQLKDLGDVGLLEVHINSPGGNVFDGIAIFNSLVQHPAPVHVYIDGVAASIASVIAMAGDKIFMPSNTVLFVHEPWMYTAGNADELRKDADMLDTTRDAIVNSYLRHLKGSSDQVAALMKEETWMSADEAANTFNNVVVLAQEKEIAASLDMHNLGSKIPKAAKAFLFEEDEEKEGILAKVVKHLNRKGFQKAAEAISKDLLEHANQEPTQEDEDMTPEAQAALKEEILNEVSASVGTTVSDAVQTSLIAAGVIPDPAATPDQADVTAFVGDPSNPEDVQAHLKKIEAAKGAAILASGDADAIQAYLASLEPFNGSATPAGDQPAGNLTASSNGMDDTAEQKKEDIKDTVNFLVEAMPKR